MTPRTQAGNNAETFIANTLEQQGFSILARNYRKVYGEVDIIAQRGNTLSFVEVKMRNNSHFGMEQLITPSKQRRIALVAKEYISTHNVVDMVCQFDVALVKKQNGALALDYIENAFTCPE